MDYTDKNFDITNIECFDNGYGLIEISNYLDFALSTTIRKQLPNITIEQEKGYATKILKSYVIDGSSHYFTRDFNIKNNIKKIGKDKVKFLICKHLIECQAYNESILHMMQPTEFIDESAQSLTVQVSKGNFDQIEDWIDKNMGAFIDDYVSSYYKSDIKKQLNEIALEHPICNEALTQLNLEMSLRQTKQKQA